MVEKDKRADKYLHDLSYASSGDEDAISYLEHADRTQLSTAKAWWFFGQWDKLAELDITSITSHPDFSKLALLKACACQQIDDPNNAEKWLRVSLNSGCDKQLVAKLMTCGLEYKLAKIHLLNGNRERAKIHMENALDINWKGMDVSFGVDIRLAHELTKQGMLEDSSEILNKQFKAIEQNENIAKSQAKIGVVKSELELINHQLMLALQKNQLYKNNKGKKKKTKKKSKINLDELRELSTSQLGQDLWVLEKTNYKKKGFFVEFGATDGVLLSNTYLLEKEFNWTGLCAEPNPTFFEKLKHNRKCITDNACIYSTTGEKLSFVLANEFGGLENEAISGKHKDKVQAYKSDQQSIIVETITLDDFLKAHNAPKKIDYISIDTEGSEYEILSSFPFSKWDVRLFTIEHNFEPQREKINKLLTDNGYKLFECQWDDWYLKIK